MHLLAARRRSRPMVEFAEGVYTIRVDYYFSFVAEAVVNEGLSGEVAARRAQDLIDYDLRFFRREISSPRVVKRVIDVRAQGEHLVIELEAEPRNDQTKEQLLGHLAHMMNKKLH